ncbi:MAG: glycoside hydrolase family 3 C-terminal domain-containing protein [Spirochaetales bacterium]|nr:glycoside hydrolase family 3 C-terminal domain-containing protein [Spirochaetales bacterium]
MKNTILLSIFFITAIFFITGCNGEEGTAYPDAIFRNPEYSAEERTEDLLSKMSLDEKIGQMTQAENSVLFDNKNDIRKYYIGSILSGGGAGPRGQANAKAWADMYDEFQSYALRTRIGVPMIYGVDAVHGHNNVKGAVIFPHNIGLGCTRNPELVGEVARITALEVAATGIDWTFAPCIAVPRNERWGRTYEGFGETPELVAMMAEAAVKGFQGANLSDPETILACAKHFLADGGTMSGKDQGNALIDETELREIHLPGYLSAINAGVGSIMASFSSWNGNKMHGNKYLLTDVLKTELGFSGFVVSDWQAINQLPGGFDAQVRESINAGIDMVMVPHDYREFFKQLKKEVEGGKIPMERIDDAVRRILKIKFQMGLFENPLTDRSLLSSVGSKEHREVARDAVRQSLVLLQNKNRILPLAKNLKHIHVTGKSADNMGRQCGGWTITWQGESGRITAGTTVLDAIKNTVSPDTKVTYSSDGKGADIGIVVIGEEPYAEGKGDSNDLDIDEKDKTAIESMKKLGIPFVVILISGRPLLIQEVLKDSDAFIAAWLPGSEGQGIADVLFGDYKPTGKLSLSWPKTMIQIPVNVGDPVYDPLFEYGFGLTY